MCAQEVNGEFQIRRERCVDLDALVSILKTQSRRVQWQTCDQHGVAAAAGITFEQLAAFSIERVDAERVPRVREMHANLVHAALRRTHFDQ